jgi:hypothetical protein
MNQPLSGPPPEPNDAYNQAPTIRMPTTPRMVANQPAHRGGPAPQRPPQPVRMPRERAQKITRAFKNALIAGSIMAFGALAALAAGHVTGVTAQGATGSSAGSGATTPSAPTSTPRSNDDSGGFFNSAPSSGGFGVSPNAPSTAPMTGSSVS